MKFTIESLGFAAYIALELQQSGIVKPEGIEFEIENESVLEALERNYAASEFNRFNQVVMTYGTQRRKLKQKQKDTP